MFYQTTPHQARPKKQLPTKKNSVSKKKTAAKKTAVKKRAVKKSPHPRVATARSARQATLSRPRKRGQEKRSTRRKIILYSLFSVLFSLSLLFSYSLFIRPAWTGGEYIVASGASVSRVVADLNQGDIFKFLIRARGGRVMAGTYDIPESASVWRLARMLSLGEIASASITIPEGLTSKQIALLLGAAHEYKDGELFPDTYSIPKGSDPAQVIDMMKKKMDRVRENWERAGRRLPAPLKDWNEVMTLASIVQKETPRASEMPVVASVYLNRLRKKMRLQADPTVVYAITGGLGDMQGRPLFSKHLQTASPYNTYRNAGLPPAPIANVGMDAIAAVLNPADTNYLYFVADGTGGHSFSRTLDEHNANRSVWRRIKKKNNE
ncbi:MAG: endolytic transglycosylase MltG [Rickettsiales bacterium]|nr:endolytic transglycosylase MltG [Rickettsiales bacterium]